MKHARNARRLRAALLVTLLALSLQVGAQQVQTFLIRSQPAAALIDTVQPLLNEGGGVSAYRDRLIVRGSPTEIAAVRKVLEAIDRPPRRLIVEVRRRGGASLSTSGVGFGARTDHAEIGRPPAGGADLGLGYQQLETRIRDDSLQRVRVVEGRPALIRTGQSLPVYQGYRDIYGNRVVQGFEVHYRDVDSGFFALPRVHGDEVSVEIYQQREQAAFSGRFERQLASSVVTGRLGDWMLLATTGGSDSDQRNAIGTHFETRRAQDSVIELRVLAVD